MAKWEEVLDHQVDLYKFWRSPLGERFANGYVESVATVPYGKPYAPDEVRRLYGNLAERAANFLYGAEAIYVDPDMMTLAEAAAATFEPEPLQPNDLITERGFVFLPRPVTLIDVWGKVVSYRAISWRVVNYTFRVTDGGVETLDEARQGVYLLLYHLRGDPDEYDRNDEHVLRRIDHEQGLKAPALTLTHVAPWVFGQPYFDGTANDEAAVAAGVLNPQALHGAKSIAQFVGALFRLATQTIAVRTEMKPSRAYRKRAAKLLPEGSITVITLRRHRDVSYPGEPSGDAPDWQFRWLVSGHWRNQWFPSLGIHRQVWISPYVKGPEDRPLNIRVHRVFKLVR